MNAFRELSAVETELVAGGVIDIGRILGELPPTLIDPDNTILNLSVEKILDSILSGDIFRRPSLPPGDSND
ncbi:hypothetical protein [Serratia sp. 1D1416]|uniref:hypothetical protein n=1 Tax=Serratia sp. 1D1416 TaxID=2447890 RepID=UPI001013CC09|nr:hypothetical protein [Serratia sp. 1D1416]